jgi:hypothetical protein
MFGDAYVISIVGGRRKVRDRERHRETRRETQREREKRVESERDRQRERVSESDTYIHIYTVIRHSVFSSLTCSVCSSLCSVQKVAATLNWPSADAGCTLCKTGQTEDQCHLFVLCRNVRGHFDWFLRTLRVNMMRFGAVGEYILGRVTNSDPAVILRTLAGANQIFPDPPLGMAEEKHTANCARLALR